MVTDSGTGMCGEVIQHTVVLFDGIGGSTGLLGAEYIGHMKDGWINGTAIVQELPNALLEMFALLCGGCFRAVWVGFGDGGGAEFERCVCGRAVYRAFGLRVVQGFKSFLNILGHGDVNISVWVVPFEGKATIEGTGPVNGDGVVLLECIDEVLGIGFVDVFDAKVIDTETEPDGLGIMFP